jgi:hypothetical protein
MPLLVGVVLAVVVIATYLTYTAGRLDRVAVRSEAAWSALDAQLARRAAATVEVADHLRELNADDAVVSELLVGARAALEADPQRREKAENELTAQLHAVHPHLARLPGERAVELLAALSTASLRVAFARQFLADALREEHALRRRPVPRLLSSKRTAPGENLDLDDPTLPEIPGIPLR